MSEVDECRPCGADEAGDRAATADKYERMLRLADRFAAIGEEMRERARLGHAVLVDEDVAGSAELSPRTWERAEEDVRAAATGKHGLETYALELDADALVVRATVLTYRWIDELQDAAYRTLGSIAGRAVGYLAPEVELGGAIVSAGLIETDAVDRDGVSAYLNELAEAHPALMDHLTSGGGGLVEGLQMRSLLTAGVAGGEVAAATARGGLRAAGVEPLPVGAAAGLRDAAGPLLADEADAPLDGTATAGEGEAPRCVEQLLATVTSSRDRVAVQPVAPGRAIAYLPGSPSGRGRLRLVGADASAHTRQVAATLSRALRAASVEPGPDGRVRLMLVGCGPGGVAAAEIAAAGPTDDFEVDQVVIAGAPAALVPVIPPGTRVLALEDRADPVVLLGSLVNAGTGNRLTVVYDGAAAPDGDPWLAGARAVDAAADEAVRAALRRMQELGYLAG